jgi:hypothetical protein
LWWLLYSNNWLVNLILRALDVLIAVFRRCDERFWKSRPIEFIALSWLKVHFGGQILIWKSWAALAAYKIQLSWLNFFSWQIGQNQIASFFWIDVISWIMNFFVIGVASLVVRLPMRLSFCFSSNIGILRPPWLAIIVFGHLEEIL